MRQLLDTAEAEIAISALSGVEPGRIMRHAVIVLDEGGDVHVSTSCCKDELPQLISDAGLLAVTSALKPGPCEHGSHS